MRFLPGRRWFFLLKPVLAVAIVAAVGWQFHRILQRSEIWEELVHLRPAWLVLSGILYLLGLACQALFWWRLCGVLGDRPPLLAILRAYALGQVGRYIPGQVVGLLVRGHSLSGHGVPTSTAAITIVCEVLTSLTAGVLLGLAILAAYAVPMPGHGIGLCVLLVVLGVPILPPVAHRLIPALAKRFFPETLNSLPMLTVRTLGVGLAWEMLGWFLKGASLWTVLKSLPPAAVPLHVDTYLQCTAFTSVAAATGFVVLVVPSGLGVRELLLQRFLTPALGMWLAADDPKALAVVAVLLLRLVWVTAEACAAGVLYFVRTEPSTINASLWQAGPDHSTSAV